MTYYPDLSPHQYSGADGSLNVGWLDKVAPFATGNTSAAFKAMLLRLCVHRAVHRSRGWHPCPFCGAEMPEVTSGDKTAALGTAEIRVKGRSATYAAPDLIYHYVVAHKYRPPAEFIEAVLAAEASSTNR